MMGLPAWAILKSRTCRQRRQVQVRPAGPREYKNYAECKDVSLYSAGVESFRAERGSGSDKRSVSDSLYDDVQHLGFRGVRGDRFLTYSNRAGSLETCGFKQRFWSLLGLRPKVTHARKCGVLPSKKRMSGPSRTTPIPAKSISPSKKRNPAPLGAGSL